mgnify:CR=1 FL=1
MSTQILDRITADPDQQERYARIALACLTIPGEPNPPAVRLTGTNGPAVVQHTLDTLSPAIAEQTVIDALDSAADGTHRVLIPTDPEWPIALWASGDLDLLTGTPARAVTITGARAATSYGDHAAAELAHDLTSTGRSIITGGAYGIDAVATRATLAASGHPIVVLASGIDRPYPAGNTGLLHQVTEQGLVLTETPPSVAPTRSRFVARTRILAALAAATVIVEAGARSGAPQVAHTAHRLARTVGAVPGPITSTTSTGCHLLIQAGIARLITSADDLAPTVDE